MNQHLPRHRPHNDNSPSAVGSRLVEDVIMGCRFYSRIPLSQRPHRAPDLSRIALALPFTSVALGMGPALLLLVLIGLGLPAVYAAALAVASAVIITGAMSEDGLADAADGLFGGATAEQRLEIMKDSRHGTYGVAALCLFLVLRVVAIGAIAGAHPLAGAATWLAALVLARSGALWLSVVLPSARREGVSATAGRVTRRSFAMGAVFALIVSFVLAGPAVSVLGLVLALALAVGVTVGWAWLCERLVGGQTGDLIGALQALIEIAVLTVFIAFV